MTFYKTKKLLSIILIAAFIFINYINVYALDPVPPTSPQRVSVDDIGYADASFNEWFTELRWQTATFPADPVPFSTGTDFYFDKIERGSGLKVVEDISISLPPTVLSLNTLEYGVELENGTIYEFYGKAYYKYGEIGQFMMESGRSNRAKFMTNIDFTVELVPDTNQIKIRWDDVWDTTGRLNYRILISDTSGFTQPPAIPDILGTEIGQDGRVTVSGQKLEYIYNGAMPGREYSIKILPLVSEDIKAVPENLLPVKKIKTEIILKTKKIGTTNNGNIWKLFWDPIIKGSIGSSTYESIYYKLYRYDEFNNEEFFAQIPDKDYFYILVSEEEQSKYRYKVEAIAEKSGGQIVPFYSNKKVALEEQIPEYPEAPELVEAFPEASPEPLYASELITKNSAVVLWKVPKTGEGLIDNNITYDIYLVDNLDDVEILPESKRIASSLKVSEDNFVFDNTGKLIGYKHELRPLKANSTYYMVMVAKKNYLSSDNSGGTITRAFSSEPVVRVIVTKPDTGLDRPIAPPSPPFKIKDGDASITSDTVKLQMRREWYELFNTETGKWEYVIQEDFEDNSYLDDLNPLKRAGRFVSYESGWRLIVYCVEYDEALKKVKSLYGRDNIIYSDLSKNALKTLALEVEPVVIPQFDEEEEKIFDFSVEGLDDNTPYILWVTVDNNLGAISDPSDSVFVTTLPIIPDYPEKPVVPVDLRGIAADRYVDLFWTIKQDYSYDIKYGKKDNVSESQGAKTLTWNELKNQPYTKITGLEQDTIYYFWIRSIATTSKGEKIYSEWSNSIILKTEPYYPPDTPRGFGISSDKDAITNNSISYEWLDEGNVTYILEFSDNADFKDSQEISINEGNKHRVSDLISNHTYFARLYAYDTETTLRSEPTVTMMVSTKKSNDDYDSGTDLDKPLAGDIVEFDNKVVSGVWSAVVKGPNADRFIEMVKMDTKAYYVIDLSEPPGYAEEIIFNSEGRVYEALSSMRKNIVLKTPFSNLFIYPDALLTDKVTRYKADNTDYSIRIGIASPPNMLPTSYPRNLATQSIELLAGVGYNDEYADLGKFNRDIAVLMPFNKEKLRDENMLFQYVDNQWNSVDADYNYELGIVKASMDRPSILSMSGDNSTLYKDIASSPFKSSIENVMKLYPLKTTNGMLRPSDKVNLYEAAQYALSILDIDNNTTNSLDTAKKAGILKGDLSSEYLRRDSAVAMLVEILRNKTKTDFKLPSVAPKGYTDFSLVDKRIQGHMAFAVENGILSGRGNGILDPTTPITRLELIIMLERILMLSGEL